jgi:hypothetical protein
LNYTHFSLPPSLPLHSCKQKDYHDDDARGKVYLTLLPPSLPPKTLFICLGTLAALLLGAVVVSASDRKKEEEEEEAKRKREREEGEGRSR